MQLYMFNMIIVMWMATSSDCQFIACPDAVCRTNLSLYGSDASICTRSGVIHDLISGFISKGTYPITLGSGQIAVYTVTEELAQVL